MRIVFASNQGHTDGGGSPEACSTPGAPSTCRWRWPGYRRGARASSPDGRRTDPAAGGPPRAPAHRGAEGAAGGVLVVAQDLSEGRRLEERQQRFLADAHELKTPLTAILGAAELLDEDDETDPEIRRRFLGRIHSEARRMMRLSETLLRLARTGTVLREPRMLPLEMGFLKAVAERAEPLAEGAGIELVMEDRGGLVLVDPEWLEQALLILVSTRSSTPGGAKGCSCAWTGAPSRWRTRARG